MARARNIKPGFFQNDLLAEIHPLGRILFAGIWTIADRDGRLEDRVKKIKAQILPYDDCDCDALLQSLHDKGFILRYASGENRFISVVKWCEHQNPHMKEAASTIQAPCLNSACMESATTQTGASPADSLNPITLTLNPITDSHGNQNPAAPQDIEPPAFDEAWRAYPKRPGASRAASLKAYKARMKAGVDCASILSGINRYAAYIIASRTEPQFIKQPATFFGPDEFWKADWDAGQAPAAKQSRHSGFDAIDYSEGIENGRIL